MIVGDFERANGLIAVVVAKNDTNVYTYKTLIEKTKKKEAIVKCIIDGGAVIASIVLTIIDFVSPDFSVKDFSNPFI